MLSRRSLWLMLPISNADKAMRGALCTGLPVVLKDLIEVDGEVTTLGSKHFENRRSPYNSATLERRTRSWHDPAWQRSI
jgi:Asp-tRNA(Asn)/Glu-tRNA(Gln) amidotransferase A subunit family amidase